MTARSSGVRGIFSDREAVDLASPLSGPHARLDPHRAQEVAARACWTSVVEPGDAFGGVVRDVLGAVESLELLVRGADRAEWLQRLGSEDQQVVEGLQDALSRWTPRVQPAAFRRVMQQGARWQQRLILPDDEQWPSQLDDLGMNAPAALWVRGDPAKVGSLASSVALVGSRAATAYGTEVTAELAERASGAGIAVVSGGAFGIDAAAHRVVLAAGGETVCVLAGGLDRFYPSAHQQLIERIEDKGAVVAEVPSGVPPARWRFLARNRVIAALVPATIVVEAGRRSGAINTAGHAAALGRQLGAVPGPVTSGTSTGCHRLLREYSAEVIEGGDDLVRLVHGEQAEDAVLDVVGAEEVRILDALSIRQARSSSEVAQLAGLSHDQVLGGLGLLELAGSVRSRPDGFVKTRGTSA